MLKLVNYDFIQVFKKGPEALAHYYLECGHVAPSSMAVEQVERRLELSRQLQRGMRRGTAAADIVKRSRSDTDLSRVGPRRSKCIKCIRKQAKVEKSPAHSHGQIEIECPSCQGAQSYTLLAML